MTDAFTFASAGRRTIAKAAQLREAVAAEGRDGDAFPIELTVSYGFSEDRWESMVGDAKDVGISHVCVNTMSTTSEWAGTPPPNLTRPAEHIAALAKFIAQVG